MKMGKMIRILYFSLLDFVRRNLATITCPHSSASPILVIKIQISTLPCS